MGRGTNNGHPLLTKPELFPRDSEAGNRTAKIVPALRMAPVECSHKETNP